MYSFAFKTNTFEIDFKDFNLEYPGLIRGKLGINYGDLIYDIYVDLTPKDIITFSNLAKDRKKIVHKLPGLGWYLDFEKTKEFLRIALQVDGSKNPLNENINSNDNNLQLNLQFQCDYEDFERFVEEIGNFSYWIEQEISKV